jgi:hypothetical protein
MLNFEIVDLAFDRPFLLRTTLVFRLRKPPAAWQQYYGTDVLKEAHARALVGLSFSGLVP